MAEIKRVTLHPLNPDGTIDTNTNLYPKTLATGIVNEEGEAVSFPDDSTLVHNSGNENIGGEKTFTNNITIATPAGWAGLYFSTDEGKSLAHIEMGEKGIKLRSEDNNPDSSHYKQYASFNIDPIYGAEFNLYDKGIYFRQRAMQNLCSGYLRFENVNNVDELHLVTYSNDVQTDIVFPAAIDDRVELATKDNCGTKLYRHYLGYLEPISGYHGYFYFITRSNESITSIIDLENQLRDFIWPQTIIMLDDSNYNRYIAGIYCDFNGSMYITNARNDGISAVIQSITFNQDIIQPL